MSNLLSVKVSLKVQQRSWDLKFPVFTSLSLTSCITLVMFEVELNL